MIRDLLGTRDGTTYVFEKTSGSSVRYDLGLGAVIVRPDSIIAWAGDRDRDRDAFERAISRWFGGPA